MKSLKKIIFAVLIVLIAGVTIKVNASCVPWYWTINGKDMTNGNTSTTASLERCSTDTITLTLNNYNGEGFKLECLGTCSPSYKFIIELKGENVITGNNIGIDLGYHDGKIEFKGDGTLKINAPKPISYENYENKMIIKPASNVYTDKEEVKEESKETEEVTTDVEEDTTAIGTSNDNMVLYIAFGSYALLTLIIIIILVVALTKKNKKEVI